MRAAQPSRWPRGASRHAQPHCRCFGRCAARCMTLMRRRRPSSGHELAVLSSTASDCASTTLGADPKPRLSGNEMGIHRVASASPLRMLLSSVECFVLPPSDLPIGLGLAWLGGALSTRQSLCGSVYTAEEDMRLGTTVRRKEYSTHLGGCCCLLSGPPRHTHILTKQRTADSIRCVAGARHVGPVPDLGATWVGHSRHSHRVCRAFLSAIPQAHEHCSALLHL